MTATGLQAAAAPDNLHAMALNSINRLRWLRLLLTGMRRRWLEISTGVEIHPSASISLSSRFIAGQRGGIRVGADSLIAFKTLLDARDPLTGAVRPIRVGERCFIGGGSMILPGVTIGDGVIVAAGAVVMDDVPGDCIVAGNPARIIRQGIDAGRHGRLPVADENVRSFNVKRGLSQG
jgi:maltose O-acetyltransferase